ncbi:MAG TPA: NAD(P)/FAD-dependent oxidoreductase [Vitreimonas sp.]|uniref:FAD-dependent oxidoreductase n=1 Tax=Vitreimonas sp. TaxID=3069702 RepID=UPI002D4AFC3D|nr:NAD(P)/FAD-dependent oxidoreductase [Vitreimonas sp.]HYD89255.1 NAD(P)/FAD-dependent oxidoreductase [Vitreimonas sp.]
MTRAPLDIAIAGCGVAGLALATLLRQQGARVVVYDRLQTPRPLGSGIIVQPVGLHVLDAIGAGRAVRELGSPIERLYGLSGERIVLDVRYRARGRQAACGLGVHRGALFQALYDAALASGAEIVSGHEIVGASDGRLAFAGGKQSATFDLVVDALGMRSPLSRPPDAPLPFGALWASLDWAGPFDPAALEQRYVAARKMAGVLPIGRLQGEERQQTAFFWSLKHADHAAWRATPLAAWKDEVLALWPATAPLLQQIRSHDDLVFASYAHRTLRAPVSRHCAHVGDSWHCASPQLGQGANMALLDAFALARALETQSNLDAALGEYARTRLWHIRLYQAVSYLFTPAYQSDSAMIAWLRDFLLSPLSRIPPAPQMLAALVAGEWGAPVSAIGLPSPRERTRAGEG